MADATSVITDESSQTTEGAAVAEEEEAVKKKLQEQEADAKAQAAVAAAKEEEEKKRLRKERGNGMVKLVYEQYDNLFPIAEGSTTQAAIDEVYCLSFVMPNCRVRLSFHPNAERFEREAKGVLDSLVPEEPNGIFQNLIKDQTYYVVVEQEADQLKRDQETTKAKWNIEKQENAKKDDERGFESCSCVYGNPCVDEYGCKDWDKRFAIATANGWKGFWGKNFNVSYYKPKIVFWNTFYKENKDFYVE